MKLHNLSQTCLVEDYVKAFMIPSLDIHEMSNMDKFFYFMEDLKPYLYIKLNRQMVDTILIAIAAAKWLIDY